MKNDPLPNGIALTTLHHGFNMSPQAMDRKRRALERWDKTLKHWEHERDLTNDKARTKYCEKKIDKVRTTIANTKSNLGMRN